MATIEKRANGTYRVKVRRRGPPLHTATFQSLADAKKWVVMTETAIVEGRHFPTSEAKRHTVAALIDRYRQEVLPHKSRSSLYMQTLQLQWWTSHLKSLKAEYGFYPPRNAKAYSQRAKPAKTPTCIRLWFWPSLQAAGKWNCSR